MKFLNKLSPRLTALLLVLLLIVVPMVTMGATWVRNVGLLPSSAVVFASDAPAIDRFMASIMHGIYGDRCGLCSGANDEVQLAAAQAAADRLLLSSGQFEIEGGAEHIIDDCTVVGQGSDFDGRTVGSILNLGGNSDVIRIKDRGKLQHFTVTTPTNFSGIAIHVMPDTGAYGGIDQEQDVLYDLVVYGDQTNKTGTGVKFECDSTAATNFIQFMTCEKVVISGYDVGLWIEVDEPANVAWFNGNNLFNFFTSYTNHAVVMDTVSGGPEIIQNQFFNWQLEANAGTTDLIDLNGAVEGIMHNMFLLTLWDVGNCASDPIEISGEVYYNQFWGNLGGTLPDDAAHYNMFYDTQTPTLDLREKPNDDRGTGLRIEGNLGEAVAIGELCFLGADDEWHLVDADAAATTKGLLGICLKAGNNGDQTEILLRGTIRHDAWTWTVGATQYASTTPGAMQEAVVAGLDDVLRVVAFCLNRDDVIMFDPSNDYFEIDGAGAIKAINGVAIH